MRPERSLYRTLVRHFANRLFDTELVAAGGSLRDSAATVLGLLAAVSVVVAYGTVSRHWTMNARTPEHVRAAMEWADREFMISMSMAVVAAVAVLCWQSAFPDRRDSLILSALPVRTWTMMRAKLTTLGAVFLATTAAMNWATTFFFPVASVRYLTAEEALRSYAAHVAAVGSASAFVFLLVLTAQALLANVLPFRVFQRVSAWAQLGALFVVLLLFFVTPPIASLPRITLPENRQSALMLPAFWFLSLYQKMLGTRHPFLDELATLAVRALGMTALSCAVLYGIAWRRVMLRTIEESGAVGESGPRRWTWAERAIEKLVLGNARERAAFHFAWRTMTRNRSHRLMLAAYSSIGLVYVVNGIASLVKKAGGMALLAPNVDLSAIPLVLPFFVLLGFRALFAVPVELQANWIFRLTDAGRPRDYVRAARKLMLLAGVLPICLLALPVFGVLWGWRIAFAHTAMSLLASMAALEWMMAGFHKVPFTCPWMPGKGNLKTMFGVWVVLFLAGAYFFSHIELWLASDPRRSAVGIGLCASLWLYRVRRRRAEEPPESGVVWEEPPVWHMQTLELSQ